MKTILLPSIAAASLALLSSCANPLAGNAPIAGDAGFSSGVRSAVDQCRAEVGSPGLARHEGLDRLALVHSEYLRRNREGLDLDGQAGRHMGSYGRTLAARRIYDFNDVNQFVVVADPLVADAKSPGTVVPEVVVKEVNETSEDQMAVCNKNWTHMGVGVVTDDDGTVFSTQIFATKNQYLDRARTQFSQ